MDSTAVLTVLSALIIFVAFKLKSLLVATPKLNLPPGPWTLPVVGSAHHLVTGPNIYRAMSRLAQKHGPVMMLHLGEVPTLVVSSPEAAEAVTKTHDIALADRYISPTLSTLFYHGSGLALAPYGERWRQLRKMSAVELFSAARVASFRHIREEEVARFLQQLTASSGPHGGTVDLTKMIYRLINDTFVRESIGSRCLYQDEYLDALHTAIQQTSGLKAADLFPSSRLLQILGMAPRKALECRKRIERILDQIIQEKQPKGSSDPVDEDGNEGFLSVLLRLQKENGTPVPLTNETVVALMSELFFAGSDTSAVTLVWCMTELVRSPAVMAKVQAEVRDAFKGKNTITEHELEGLSYLKLVIKETLRLHTPAPVLIPRTSREPFQFMGYYIPKGTMVLVNVWSICRDHKYWDDPEEFKPERFESNNLDYKGANYEFLPFGSGRRMCPGINLGVGNIELALASLLYHFDWKLPDGIQPKDVDVLEADGLIGSKRTQLVLQPVIRIPPGNIVVKQGGHI